MKINTHPLLQGGKDSQNPTPKTQVNDHLSRISLQFHCFPQGEPFLENIVVKETKHHQRGK
jgi:hypothetical protein